MTSKVLVTDGRSLSALAIVRSLGNAGIEVHVCDDFRTNLSAFSRHVSKSLTHMPIDESPNAFAAWLVDQCLETDYDLVIPVRDQTTLVAAANQAEISAESRLYLAESAAINTLSDKARCMKAADNLGISIPKTYYPSEESLESIRTSATFPVVIKPRISSGARGIVRVEAPDELERAYDRVTDSHQDPIIQEFVSHSGGHYSIGTIFDDSAEPVATHVYRETRQYPDSGGPAIAARTVEREPWTESLLDVLRAHDWKGPAHMDVLYDDESDEYRLLEVNPRFWSSLALSINAGVDVPRILYELATEETAPSAADRYRTDTHYRWMLPNELLWLFEQTDKPAALRALCTWEKATCCATVTRDDPRPLIGVFTQGLGYLQNTDRRKKIFDRGWER